MIRIVSLFLSILFICTGCRSADEELERLFDDFWEYSLQTNPVFATSRGDHRFNDRLPATGPEAVAERNRKTEEFLSRLENIPREPLSDENRTHYDILKIRLEQSLRGYELNDHLLPLNGWWDYHATFADLPNRIPLENAEDYDNYLSRLAGFPDYNRGYMERLRRGVDLGFVRPRVVFEDYLASVEALISSAAEESRLYEPFEEIPETIEEKERERLRSEAVRILSDVVIPEFKRLSEFLREEYIPATTETIGISELPGGEEYYRYLTEYHTTLEVTPEEIHQTGLDEVERIRGEMMEIVREEGFGDDFEGFVEYLRTDQQFYAETPEELMKKTAFVLKRIDGKLPELFKTLPRLPYGIMEIPDYLAPRTATAYYSRGTADGTRAGFYAVNTYDLPGRPLYEIPALSMHEAVPGHHLQIALQQELEDLPEFRKTAGFTAYVEGWALYAERLGIEMDMYEDPYENFGRLSYEMWRALRLVVDTGMHAKGWSREEAIDFMAANSALSMHNIRSEVDRYIFWPGQALAYKMGEIAIRRLRNEAEEALGEDFDLREFHDVILLSGSVPLSVLEANVKKYIDGTVKK